jgi:hypothetical protein
MSETCSLYVGNLSVAVSWSGLALDTAHWKPLLNTVNEHLGCDKRHHIK